MRVTEALAAVRPLASLEATDGGLHELSLRLLGVDCENDDHGQHEGAEHEAR